MIIEVVDNRVYEGERDEVWVDAEVSTTMFLGGWESGMAVPMGEPHEFMLEGEHCQVYTKRGEEFINRDAVLQHGDRIIIKYHPDVKKVNAR